MSQFDRVGGAVVSKNDDLADVGGGLVGPGPDERGQVAGHGVGQERGVGVVPKSAT
jgi:hypothetical protein